MTDQEIIQGLIARDNRVTEEFFFDKCRPLFCKIIKLVFEYEVDYDEFVNELYVYLMKNDARKLRDFQFRSTVYQWLKVVAIRYFINKKSRMIEDKSQEAPYSEHDQVADVVIEPMAQCDMEQLFDSMPNQRYVYAIRRLILEDASTEQVAEEMNTTTTNLYNIKHRAMAQLTSAALNDIKEYGK